MSTEPTLLSTVVEGVLEIDHQRGVIYFTSSATGRTILRICSLPRPIPEPTDLLDITHLHGASWTGADVMRTKLYRESLPDLRLRKPHTPPTPPTT